MDLTTTSKLPKRNALIEFLKISTNSIVRNYNRSLPTLLSLLAKATCELVSFVIFTIDTCSTNAFTRVSTLSLDEYFLQTICIYDLA